jgi:hypothetical protein
MKEIWKDIPGYEGFYQASNYGNIKSLERNNGRGYRLKEKILKPGIDNIGRLHVNLLRYGIQKSYRVHRLVLMAFIGRCPDGMECMHLDDNPSNNNLENLRWGTHMENQRMIHDHGRANPPDFRGGKSPLSKLTQDQVYRIRFLKGKVEYGYWTKLAKAIDISHSTIKNVLSGKTWRDA